MTTTPNLALTQYATTDKINWVNEYNKDMLNIDTAVKANQTSLDATNAQVSLKANKVDLDSEALSRTQKDTDLQNQMNSVVVGSNTSPAETVQARTDLFGITHTTLKSHTDSIENILANNKRNLVFGDWEQGGILSSGNSVNTTRIRTAGYYDLEPRETLTVTPLAGYKVAVVWYDATNTYKGQSDWCTVATDFFVAYPRYRFLIANTSDSTITADASINATFQLSRQPSTNLAVDKLGDIFNQYLLKQLAKASWEYGSLQGTASPYTESATTLRIRTSSFSVDAGSLIFCNSSNYKFSVCGDLTYLAMTTVNALISTSQNIRIVMAKTDDSTITPSDFSNMVKQLIIIPGKSLLKKRGYLIPYSTININTKTKQLEFPLGTGVHTDSKTYSLQAAKTVSYDGFVTTLLRLNFHPSDTSFSLQAYSEPIDPRDASKVFCGYLRVGAIGYTTLQLAIGCDYTIDGVYAKDELPVYYKDEISTKETEILNSFESGRVAYSFITDLHYDQDTNNSAGVNRQLKSFVELTNNSDLDFAVVGGDLIMGTSASNTDALSLIKTQADILAECKKPIFILKGNHDYNSFGTVDGAHIVTYNQWYANTIGRFENDRCIHDSQYPYSTYWYYDLTKKKTRLIFMDSSDWDDDYTKNQGQSYLGFSSKQCRWFIEEALTKNETGWKYIIFSHIPIDIDYTCWGVIPENSNKIAGIITSLNKRQSYNDGTYVKDFSSYLSKVLLFHYGHVHADLILKDTDTDMVYMSTRNACTYPRDYTLSELQITYQGYTPPSEGVYGTITEAAYDLVSITDNQIKSLRFGNGDDKTLSLI